MVGDVRRIVTDSLPLFVDVDVTSFLSSAVNRYLPLCSNSWRAVTDVPQFLIKFGAVPRLESLYWSGFVVVLGLASRKTS